MWTVKINIHIKQLTSLKKTAYNKGTAMQLIIASSEYKLVTSGSKCNKIVLAWRE